MILAKEMKNFHQTAETKYVEAKGIKFAYRSFGNKASVPLIFLQHFTGTMDNWDPMVTDGIAEEHHVILFNNAGISSSSGKTPGNVDAMAEDALAFIDALSLKQVDLLGFSLGGFIAQLIVVKKPNLVRKLILVGTGPEGSSGLDKLPGTLSIAVQKKPGDGLLYMFFKDTESSIKRGREFLNRIMQRTIGRDPDTTNEAIGEQMKAIVSWGEPVNRSYADLKAITHPVLVVNGSNDIVVPTKNSYTIFEQLANARLSLYPDSGHGALFQYAGLFINEVNYFLREQ
ncbi:MAG TPA: alpha/beta hydrolase [Chitinophagaceae bacterium]|nr:alpha/beta hydrolase [Chitinophagaceae bacterium]